MRTYTLSPKSIATRAHADREVRDIYNKLMKRYRTDLVMDFFDRNYYIQDDTVNRIIQRVDKDKIDTTRLSIQYQAVMMETFHL